MDRFPSMYIADCCVRDTWWSCRRIGPSILRSTFSFHFVTLFSFFFFLLLLLFFFLLIVCFGFSLVDDCCCFTHCLLVVRINSSTISTYSYINLYDMVFSYQHNGHGYWHWVCTNMFSLIQPHTDGGRGQRMVLAPCRSVALSPISSIQTFLYMGIKSNDGGPPSSEPEARVPTYTPLYLCAVFCVGSHSHGHPSPSTTTTCWCWCWCVGQSQCWSPVGCAQLWMPVC